MNKIYILLALLEVVTLPLLRAAESISSGRKRIRNTVVECNVPMRDGVGLYTTIQLPAGDGKFPVVIHRNPYFAADTDLEELRRQDTHGYALVKQHCRGTGRSGGEFNAYLNERNDGLDLLEWVRKQPFYNGEIYLYGLSYASSVHFAYLDTNPLDIKAAFLAVQDSERYNICYRNGFFKPGLHGSWVMRMHLKNKSITRNVTDETFRTFPLAGVTERVFNERVPYIENSLLHPDPQDDYWKTAEGGGDYSGACGKSSVPIFLATSFYDIYAGGVFKMWESLSPERRKSCALIVTPFDHSFNPSRRQLRKETQDFKDAVLHGKYPDLSYAWFDHFRKGSDLPLVVKGKMVYYRLWDNKWIVADDLKNGAVEKCFYLAGNRTLQTSYPGVDEITYTYDPCNPASFKGGVCHNFGGMKYQDPPNSREDIISFVSEPLAEDMICEGRIEVELQCRSTAEDTCFYLRLNLERKGKTVSLRDDIDSLCRVEKDYRPGDIRKLKYTFEPHAFKMRKGDRLRLDVSSSCFPQFQIHTNNRGMQSLQTSARSCRNTVITGKSFVRLFTVAEK